ncbi:hypothetical protein T11_5518 [Trichinella zimbabwensis]|uniref:Uncharacterized protein n=1 Tax=Trichinella zimbabwensis TaxID=268475 RepID=A0A0V1GU59_9BILA|nr:hypothetical protein T11_5518 [Trichinella zimbabwensis]
MNENFIWKSSNHLWAVSHPLLKIETSGAQHILDLDGKVLHYFRIISAGLCLKLMTSHYNCPILGPAVSIFYIFKPTAEASWKVDIQKILFADQEKVKYYYKANVKYHYNFNYISKFDRQSSSNHRSKLNQ